MRMGRPAPVRPSTVPRLLPTRLMVDEDEEDVPPGSRVRLSHRCSVRLPVGLSQF